MNAYTANSFSNADNSSENILKQLCTTIRESIHTPDLYQENMQRIAQAMMEYPHCAVPHNLMGLLLEEYGNHALAMRHFRASYSLDPSYLPARQNLELYGTFAGGKHPAFDESDCDAPAENQYEIVYDEKHIGHLVRRKSK